MRVVAGAFFLIMAVIFGINAFSDSDSSGGSTTRNVGETSNVGDRAPATTFVEEDVPQQDFSIKQSCEEIRDEYMAAPPGSDEERWALEAAEEVCFGQ